VCVPVVVGDEEEIESEFFDLSPALDESRERRIRDVKDAESELGHRPSCYTSSQASNLGLAPVAALSATWSSFHLKSGRARGLRKTRRTGPGLSQSGEPTPASPARRLNRVARMARFGVRSGSLPFAHLYGNPAAGAFERTGANRSERSLAFAMQKVEGSSPFIRFNKAPLRRGFLSRAQSFRRPVAQDSPTCGASP
jgi:hypothetical protein